MPLSRRTLLAGSVAGALGLILPAALVDAEPARRVWALDRTMVGSPKVYRIPYDMLRHVVEVDGVWTPAERTALTYEDLMYALLADIPAKLEAIPGEPRTSYRYTFGPWEAR